MLVCTACYLKNETLEDIRIKNFPQNIIRLLTARTNCTMIVVSISADESAVVQWKF